MITLVNTSLEEWKQLHETINIERAWGRKNIDMTLLHKWLTRFLYQL